MKAYPSISDKRTVSQSQTMAILLSAACLAAMLLAWSLAHSARPWASPSDAPVVTAPALGGGNYALVQTRAGNGFLEVMPFEGAVTQRPATIDANGVGLLEVMPNEVTTTRTTPIIDASGVGLIEFLPGEVPNRAEPAPSYGLQP